MSQTRRIWRRRIGVVALGLGILLAILWGAGDRIFAHRRITDGERMRTPEAWSGAMRYVWDDVGEVLKPSEGEEIRGGDVARDGALIFARRRSPGNWMLWWRPVGETEPRPAFELEQSGNDVDPTWSQDGKRVLFASDRQGGRGGFDLWIADRTEEGLSRPRPLSGPVNGPFDERHPALHPVTGALVFSSNRRSEDGLRFSLYTSPVVPGGFGPPSEFEALAEWEGDVRAPSFSPDGRSLFFASEAPGGLGGYDLYRWIRGPEGLSRVEPLTFLNGPSDEMDPAVSPDGRRILFVRCPEETPGLNGRLHAAIIREIFQMSEAPGVWWRSLVYALAALLIALLSMFLFLRWGRLHPFIKFLVLSVLAHLLFLLFAPRPQEEVIEGGGGGSPRYSFSVSREESEGQSAPAGRVGEHLRPTARGLDDGQWQPEAAAQKPPSLTRPSLATWRAPDPTQRTAQATSPAGDEALVLREKASLGGTTRPDRQAPSAGALAARRLGTEMGGGRNRLPAPLGLSSGMPATAPRRPGTDRAELERGEATVRRGMGGRGPAGHLSEGLEKISASSPGEVAARKDPTALPEGPPLAARRFDRGRPGSLGKEGWGLEGSPLAARPKVSAPPAVGIQRSGIPALPTARSGGDVSPSLTAGVAGPSRGDVDVPASGDPLRRGPTTVRLPRSAGFERLSAVSSAVGHSLPPRPAATGQAPHDLSLSAPRRREVERPWPEIYAGRRGAAKQRALEEGGGSEATEASVLAGLRYLASKQRRNGAWGDGTLHDKYGDRRAGKTGLALLAFLGAGHDGRREGEFKDTVSRGLDFLLSEQRSNGHVGGGSSYSHGIATYALAEAWALAREPKLRRPLGKAVRRIIRAQHRGGGRLDGGWGYFYADEERRFDSYPRLSVSAWQIMALASARLGGVGGLRSALDRAARFLEGAWDPGLDAFRYNHDPKWLRSGYPTLPGSSAAAVFALGLLDPSRDDELMAAGLRHILQRPPRFRWRRPPSRDFVTKAKGNLYFHYYAALALHRRGGRAWRRWNEELKRLLTKNQSSDGSWRPISPYAEYAGDRNGDRIYTTSLAVLTLEVYYRYLTPLLSKEALNDTMQEETFVVIHEVRPGSTAEQAGLAVGDIILEVNGKVVEKPTDLLRLLRRRPGKTEATELLLRRGGRLSRLQFQGPLGGLGVSSESSTHGRR